MGLQILLAGLIFLVSFSGYSQVEINKKTAKPSKEKTELDSTLSDTEVYAHANWSLTNRSLKENEGLFGDSLGVRANETGLNTWSFGFGIRSKINRHLGWEGGLNFIRNGESYSFSGTDTSYKYTTSYSYIAMPVKANFTFGDNIQFITAAGLVPQMFIQYRNKGGFTGSDNLTGQFDNKTNSGYSTFVLSAAFNLGVQAKLGSRTKVFVIPEYRMQMTSTYLNTNAYIHKGRAIGLNLGLSFIL